MDDNQKEVKTVPPIGIVSALKAEAVLFSVLDRHSELLPGHPCQISSNLILYISGIGADRAYDASQELIKKGVSTLVSWGCAGALIPDISPGDLVLPKVIITGDKTITSNTKWHDRLYSTLKKHLNVNTGPLVQHEKILATPEDKKSLALKCNAVAIDMESGAVAEAACSAGIPFIAIRAISDTANMTIPLSATKAADISGQICAAHLLMELLKNPADISGLFRLAMTFHAAKKTLKKVLDVTTWTVS